MTKKYINNIAEAHIVHNCTYKRNEWNIKLVNYYYYYYTGKKNLKIKLCWVNLTPVGVSLIINKLLHVAMLHAIV